MELNEILSGVPSDPAPQPATAPEPAAPQDPPRTGETPDQEPRDDRPRDEHGRFAPRRQDEDAAPPAARQEPGPIPIQALLDERERRQKAERERDEWRQRAAPPPTPQPRPDVFADPDGAFEHIRAEFRRDLELERQQRAVDRLNYSVATAQVQYPDYAEKEAAFIAAVQAEAQRDPSGQSALYRQMMSDVNPAGFAYRVGSQALAIAEIGPDPTQYKERLVDDDALLERMLQKRGLSLQQLQQPAAQAPAPVFPTSLSTARAAAPRQPAEPFTGPTPLTAFGNPALRMG
jgi:hypothetical protein